MLISLGDLLLVLLVILRFKTAQESLEKVKAFKVRRA